MTGPNLETTGVNDAPGEQQQHLTFMLAGDLYAMGILHVKEIIGYGHVTPVPMMPSAIRGVINLRGRVVPVVDLAVRFGRPRGEAGRRTCIVILEVESGGELQDMGVVVDAVDEVIEIGPAEIEPPPAFGARIPAEFIRGMAKVSGTFVIVLEVGRVLAVEELVVGEPPALSGRGVAAAMSTAGSTPA